MYANSTSHMNKGKINVEAGGDLLSPGEPLMLSIFVYTTERTSSPIPVLRDLLFKATNFNPKN